MPHDLQTIVQFQLQMAKETEHLQLNEQTVTFGVQKLFDHPDRGHYRIAELDGRIIASMLILYEWSDWRNGDVLWIHSLYVLPDFRAKGIFKQLYQQLRQEVADSPSLMGIRLYVDRTNEAAQKVYEKVGMTAEHYLMYEWLKS